MNEYFNISKELKSLFSRNSITKILLPIDMFLLFAGLIIMFIVEVLGIRLGGLIEALVFWVFIAGVLLTYANMHQLYLYCGLFAYAAINLISFIAMIFKYKTVSWSTIFEVAVAAFLGYFVFKCATAGVADSKSTDYKN
jgi:hypothetical protein